MTNPVIAKITDPAVRDALRLRGAMLGRPLIGPKSVNIHVINSCSYRCQFCWYFSPFVKDHPKGKMLDYKVLEQTLEDCREIGVDEINLEGGETTVYPYWADAFRKVHDLGMRLIAYTHLDYPADVKKIQALSYAELLMVNFSAITEESFKRVHGAHTSMKRVLKNMDRLLAIRDKYGKPKIRLSFVVYNYNYKELAGFLDMAHERNIDQVVVRFFEATEEMKQLVFTKEELAELRTVVEAALEKRFCFTHDLKKLYNLIVNGQMFENPVTLERTEMRNDRLLFYDSTGGEINCYVGWFYSHIDEKGRVIAPCDNVGVCVAGNINERRFQDIWFDNEHLRSTLNEASKGIHTCSSKWQECRYCSYVPTNRYLHQEFLKLKGTQADDS
ncbi:MAG: radical SAM protein [Candidatus Omnitrophica bacterium]|nr:radical SAM protein [Candidatus Omnitrophota bacterium]